MSDHALMVLFALAWVFTLFALVVVNNERKLWKDAYEKLSSDLNASTRAETERIVHELEATRARIPFHWDD